MSCTKAPKCGIILRKVLIITIGLSLKGEFIMDEILAELKEKAAEAAEYAKKLGKKTVDRTTTVLNQTKLKLAKSKVQDKITDIYTEIGEQVYRSHVDGTELANFDELFESIGTLEKEIIDIDEQITEITNNVKCPACGTNNNSANKYCAMCGEKL